MYKPMLAPLDDPLKNPHYWSYLRYPLMVSPKLDGIRCITKAVPDIVHDDDLNEIETGDMKDVCLSRELKLIPSRQVQSLFSLFSELDGELIAGPETAHNVYNTTQSHVMSVDKPHSDLKFRVFDCSDIDICHLPFFYRLKQATEIINMYKQAYKLPDVPISIVEHKLVNNYEELIEYEELMLAAGYEGIMMRDPNGRYKHNRGTMREGLIFKLKRFQDDEGLIIGFEEGMKNENEKTTNEKGYATRSESAEGMVPANTLGKFIVDYKGKTIKVAPGSFNHADRSTIWRSKEEFIGSWLKFRFFAYGVKDLPRFPRAVGFRDKIDMSSK